MNSSNGAMENVGLIGDALNTPSLSTIWCVYTIIYWWNILHLSCIKICSCGESSEMHCVDQRALWIIMGIHLTVYESSPQLKPKYMSIWIVLDLVDNT